MNIQELISQMTLEEKASLCTGATPWRTVGIERLGIEPMIVADGSHGLRRSKNVEGMITESFPASRFRSSASDPDASKPSCGANYPSLLDDLIFVI